MAGVVSYFFFLIGNDSIYIKNSYRIKRKKKKEWDDANLGAKLMAHCLTKQCGSMYLQFLNIHETVVF